MRRSLGLGGNDVIKSEEGNDIICDGDGNNFFQSGPREDTLESGADDDPLKEDVDPDLILGGNGVLTGGNDFDRLRRTSRPDICSNNEISKETEHYDETLGTVPERPIGW